MKERLDVLLVKRNLASSREKAKAVIMSGNVYVDGQKEDKPGTAFDDQCRIEVRGHTLLRKPGRAETGESAEGIRPVCGRKGLHRRRFLHRRIYRLYAAERSEKSMPSMWEEDSWTGNCAG